MWDLNDLYYFAQAVSHGGFAQAGRALGIPKSKLSRRVSELEERLAVRLIQRSTRQFIVTDAGRAYYEHCKAMLEEAHAAQDTIDAVKAEPRGILRVACPIGLLHAHMGRIVADFMAQHPRVTVHLEATNRAVDPIGEAFDVAIRVRPPPEQSSGLVLRVLSRRSLSLLASPALIARQGAPREPADLARWPTLGWGSPQLEQVWELLGPTGEKLTLRHAPRYITTDVVALRIAAEAGVGIGLFPLLFATEQLADGRLVKVLPEWTFPKDTIHAVFPTRRGLLPSVRLFLDYVAERYG
ncbi:MAG TPA: LysR family transcriptional regulator, partial [Ramlibacter sp.]|nr:LysR family transcriptional regulator [Ramlibacter sp.]